MCQNLEATKYRKSLWFFFFFLGLFLKSPMYFGKKWSNQQQYTFFSQSGENFLFWPINSQLYSNITLSDVSITEGTLSKVLKLKFLVFQLCQGNTHLPLHRAVNGWELEEKLRKKGRKPVKNSNQRVECSLSYSGVCPLSDCSLSIFIFKALMLKSTCICVRSRGTDWSFSGH